MALGVDLSVSGKPEAESLSSTVFPCEAFFDSGRSGLNTPPEGGTPNVRADGRLCPVARDPKICPHGHTTNSFPRGLRGDDRLCPVTRGPRPVRNRRQSADKYLF